SEAACDFIATSAYDPVYGARPLKRFIQHELETGIGRQLIAGGVSEGGRIMVGLENDSLKIEVGT
ncbi:MAG: hypothetical protein C0622_06875, partial [Desulfuromonas sp.]